MKAGRTPTMDAGRAAAAADRLGLYAAPDLRAAGPAPSPPDLAHLRAVLLGAEPGLPLDEVLLPGDPDHEALRARLAVAEIHEQAPASMGEALAALEGAGRLDPAFAAAVRPHLPAIEARLVPARDFVFTRFGVETLRGSFLQRAGPRLAERPQHAYMRVALALWVRGGALSAEGLEEALRVYDHLSLLRAAVASPTLLNAGTRRQQLSSCFLLRVDDSISGLSNVARDALRISANAGGVGVCLTPMRAAGSAVRGSGGKSSGILRYCALLDACRRYADQGGLRPGAFAIYLAAWHADVFTHLQMARLKGPLAEQNLHTPDMKYALWVPDAFMRVLRDEAAGGSGEWHLFSPDEAPDLVDACDGRDGPRFSEAYARYVGEGRARRTVKASALMGEWYRTVMQVGHPYVLFGDNINRRSNLAHVHTITSSNLCAEITLPSFSGPEPEYGVCNLGAVNFATFVGAGAPGAPPSVDYAALIETAADLTRALDNVIDISVYPEVSADACRRSNHRHRPLGIGSMGLADVLAQLELPFGSPGARRVDRALHAALYYGCTRASAELGARRGAHPSHAGSPASRGLLQPDLCPESAAATADIGADWAAEVEADTAGALPAAAWTRLRADAAAALRNGYVTALMPTATSSNIAGANECFEPFTSMCYPRATMAGEFVLMNRHLHAQLRSRGLWSPALLARLAANGGSVQELPGLPDHLRAVFRTARELDQRLLVLHAATRAPFVSQSMSLNLYYEAPTMGELLTALVMGWELGNTTGSYYIHTQPALGTAAQMVGTAREAEAAPAPAEAAGPTCSPGCRECAL